MAATVTDNAERIVRLETRADYVDAILEERRTIISAHSRRLADIELHLRDHHRINLEQAARLVALETAQAITKDERMKRQHLIALLQWLLTGLISVGVVLGLLISGDAAEALSILGGFVAPQ